jgi:hypothetical protein
MVPHVKSYRGRAGIIALQNTTLYVFLKLSCDVVGQVFLFFAFLLVSPPPVAPPRPRDADHSLSASGFPAIRSRVQGSQHAYRQEEHSLFNLGNNVGCL